MKTLPLIFTRDGFSFQQLRRCGDVALFRKTKPGTTIESFEVVLINRNPEWSSFGKTFPAKESMPSSEQWGTRGWTDTSLDRAEKRFAERLKDASGANSATV